MANITNITIKNIRDMRHEFFIPNYIVGNRESG